MKLTTLLLLLGIGIARADYSTNFYAIPDKTPGLTNGAAWTYPESPGTYYWNGMRTALVLGLFCIVIGAGVRYWARD